MSSACDGSRHTNIACPASRFDNRPRYCKLISTTLYGISGALRNEIGDRFENYAIRLLSSMLQSCIIRRSFRYKIEGKSVSSPDILLFYNDNYPDIIFECKSTRMSFDAKFSLDPLKEDPYGYEQIATGVFQIWRYVSQRRVQKLSSPRSSSGSVGIILTLDSWLAMSHLREEILSMARRMAEKDGSIDRRDDIPIIFFPIDDLEIILRETNEKKFFNTIIAAALEKRFDGWLLPSIHARLHGPMELRPYPFEAEVGNVLPWWEFTRQIAESVERL